MTVAAFLKNHFSLLLVLALILIILIVSWSYIAVAIFAASLAVVGMPLYRKLHRRLPAPLSAGIVTTLISVIIAAVLAVIAAVLVSDSSTLSEMLNSIIAFVGNIFNLPVGTDAGDSVVSTILNVLSLSASRNPFIASNAINCLALSCLVIICTPILSFRKVIKTGPVTSYKCISFSLCGLVEVVDSPHDGVLAVFAPNLQNRVLLCVLSVYVIPVGKQIVSLAPGIADIIEGNAKTPYR